jgi:hypothetical protein
MARTANIFPFEIAEPRAAFECYNARFSSGLPADGSGPPGLCSEPDIPQPKRL